MQLEKHAKKITCLIDFAVMALCIVFNVSFLHGVCLWDSTYFDIPRDISRYALYLTSLIGAVTISKKVADFLIVCIIKS